MFRQSTPRKEPVLRSVEPGLRQGEPAIRREEPALRDVLLTTTPTVENRPVTAYLGVVSGQSIVDAGSVGAPPKGRRGLFRKASAAEGDDPIAGARDEALRDLRGQAGAKGADAVLGVRLDHQMLGATLLVIATGTAVRLG